MQNAEFNELLETRLSKCQALLNLKANEYARGDRLHNLKRAAEAMRCTPEQACIGFAMKHIVSILDMVDDIDRDQIWLNSAWSEKVGDAINYLILLEMLSIERNGGLK